MQCYEKKMLPVDKNDKCIKVNANKYSFIQPQIFWMYFLTNVIVFHNFIHGSTIFNKIHSPCFVLLYIHKIVLYIVWNIKYFFYIKYLYRIQLMSMYLAKCDSLFVKMLYILMNKKIKSPYYYIVSNSCSAWFAIQNTPS